MTDTPLKSFDIPSDADTQALGRTLSGQLRVGDVLALHGSLGMGKTTLARAIIRSIAGDEALEVPSPTFTIVQVYDLEPKIYHVDLYRLKNADEAMELGLDDAFAEAISLVEWPDNLGPHLPAKALVIDISEDGQGGRRVQLFGDEEWRRRFDDGS